MSTAAKRAVNETVQPLSRAPQRAPQLEPVPRSPASAPGRPAPLSLLSFEAPHQTKVLQWGAKLAWPATVLLCAAYLVYFCTLKNVPLQDYPNHLARAAVLRDLLFNHGAQFGNVFQFHFAFVPYILHDLLFAGLIQLFGTTAGGVLFDLLVLLSLPAALIFYLRVMGLTNNARLLIVLLSLYFTTDWFYLMGFMAFRLAIAGVIAELALADLLRTRWSGKLYGVYLGGLVASHLIHLTSAVFLAPALLSTAAVRYAFKRLDLRRELWLITPVVVLLGSYFVSAWLSGAGLPAGPYHPDWGDLGNKLGSLKYEYVRYGKWPPPMLLLLAVGCLVWPVRHVLRWRALITPVVLEHSVGALVFLGIYLLLPKTTADSVYVDARALPMINFFVMMALLRIAHERRLSHRYRSVPLLAVAALVALVNLIYLSGHMDHNNRMIKHYRELTAFIEPGARVLSIHTLGKEGDTRPYLHIGAYAIADRGAVTPYLFGGDRGDPMRYFSYVRRPYMPDENWYPEHLVWSSGVEMTFESEGRTFRWRWGYSSKQHQWLMMTFVPLEWQRVACEYDYLLITKPFDPGIAVGLRSNVVATSMSGTLLKIDKAQCEYQSEAARRIPVSLLRNDLR